MSLTYAGGPCLRTPLGNACFVSINKSNSITEPDKFGVHTAKVRRFANCHSTKSTREVHNAFVVPLVLAVPFWNNFDPTQVRCPNPFIAGDPPTTGCNRKFTGPEQPGWYR